MSRRFLLPLWVLISFATLLAAFPCYARAILDDDKPRLTIFPFAGKGVSSEEAVRVREQFILALDQAKAFRIMSDEAMNAILTDIGFTKLEDCTTSNCAAYFGKILGVDDVLQGTIERNDEGYVLLVRLVHVSNARMIFSKQVQYARTLEVLLADVVPTLARDLSTATLEPEDKYHWYVVAVAVLAMGATIYFVGKALGFFKADRQYEATEKDPRPPGGD